MTALPPLPAANCVCNNVGPTGAGRAWNEAAFAGEPCGGDWSAGALLVCDGAGCSTLLAAPVDDGGVGAGTPVVREADDGLSTLLRLAAAHGGVAGLPEEATGVTGRRLVTLGMADTNVVGAEPLPFAIMSLPSAPRPTPEASKRCLCAPVYCLLSVKREKTEPPPSPVLRPARPAEVGLALLGVDGLMRPTEPVKDKLPLEPEGRRVGVNVASTGDPETEALLVAASSRLQAGAETSLQPPRSAFERTVGFFPQRAHFINPVILPASPCKQAPQ